MLNQNHPASTRNHAVLVLLWLIVTSYNLFKPFHIDDGAYLLIAKWIGAHPFHPMSGLLNWNGHAELIAATNQPPLYFYALAVWGWLFGFSEPALHSLQALASLACVLLFYRLANFFARNIAVWLTAVLVLGPAFIVEQNLMVDVPMMAVWLVFFNFLILPKGGQTLRYTMAAIACSAALLIKYSSLVLLPILCVSLLLERRKDQFWTPLIPIVTLAGWSIFNYFDYGGIHILSRHSGSIGTGNYNTINQLIAWIVTIGGVTPIGLIAASRSHPSVVKWQRSLYAMVLLCFGALVFAFFVTGLPESFANRALLYVFSINSCLAFGLLLPVMIRVVRSNLLNVEVARTIAPIFYLLIWVVGTTSFYVVLSPFIAVRHVAQILAPLLLIAGSRWNSGLSADSRVFGLALTALVSVGLCISDWRYAGFFKSEAVMLARVLPRTGTRWASGHWGWQWYATQEGMTEVDINKSRLQPGDYLLVAQTADHQALVTPPPMHLVRADNENPGYYEIFCTGSTTRFYGYLRWGVPWSLSRTCTNRIDVFQVDGR